VVTVRRNTECPDSKGIKTCRIPNIRYRGKEILNALIQKGLRLNFGKCRVRYFEILNALIQKGLRQCPAYRAWLRRWKY